MVLETELLIKTENQDIEGGTYRLVTYILNNGAEYEIEINNGMLFIEIFIHTKNLDLILHQRVCPMFSIRKVINYYCR